MKEVKRTMYGVTLVALFYLCLMSAMGDPGDLLQTFLNPTPEEYDGFGFSVAGMPDKAIIGAWGDNTGASSAGAVYLFDASTGNLLLTIQKPTQDESDQLGGSVAAVGNNVLAGAHGDDTGAYYTGAAYLFDGSTGALLQSFLNPTPGVSDEFGFSVAAVGNNVLVGARFDDTGRGNAGAAYLFDGSTGNLLRTFQKPIPAINDQFGYSVALMGNNVLAGAIDDDTAGDNAGAAYLFDGSTGNLLCTFLNPTPTDGDLFGCRVAALGNNVLVSDPDDVVGSIETGAVYLFDGSTGALLRTFHNPTPAEGDRFGISIAAVGNNVLIGADCDDTGASDAGAAYLFDGSTGELLLTFLNPTPAEDDYFGSSVAAIGNDVLIGAGGDDTGALGAGAAYLFEGVSVTAVNVKWFLWE